MAGFNHSILVADQDEHSRVLLAGLTGALGLTFETADTGAEVLAAVGRELPRLLLLAVDLVGPSGYEVLCQLRDRFGERVPIVFLSAANSEPRDEIAAFLLGADDYFTKPLQADQFMARARRLLARSRSQPPASTPAHVSRLSTLTSREHEVLMLLIQGHRAAEIAELLCITRKTTSTHIEHILTKLGAHSQAQAVAFALRPQALTACE